MREEILRSAGAARALGPRTDSPGRDRPMRSSESTGGGRRNTFQEDFRANADHDLYSQTPSVRRAARNNSYETGPVSSINIIVDSPPPHWG